MDEYRECECCTFEPRFGWHKFAVGDDVECEFAGVWRAGTVERHIWSDYNLAAGYDVRLSSGGLVSHVIRVRSQSTPKTNT